MATPSAPPAEQSASTSPPDVALIGLRKQFGAVDNVDLEIARGEFFTMLGPSGSGKTTTRTIVIGHATFCIVIVFTTCSRGCVRPRHR